MTDGFSEEEQRMLRALNNNFNQLEDHHRIAKADMLAAEQLRKTLMIKYFRKCLAEGRPTGFASLDTLPSEVKAVVKSGSLSDNKYFHVVLGAKPGTDFKKFWERFVLWKERQTMFDVELCNIEQRSEGDDPITGVHVHFIGTSKYAKSQLIQKLRKAFGDYIEADNFVTVEKITKDLDVRREYLRGNKKTEKMAKVAKDRMIREALGIPHYLEKEISA